MHRSDTSHLWTGLEAIYYFEQHSGPPLRKKKKFLHIQGSLIQKDLRTSDDACDRFSFLFIPGERVGGCEGWMELRACVCGGEQGEKYEARSDCMKANGGGWDWGGKSGATVWLKGSNLHLPHLQEIFAWKCCLQVTDGSTEKITNKCMFWEDVVFFFFFQMKVKLMTAIHHCSTLKG